MREQAPCQRLSVYLRLSQASPGEGLQRRGQAASQSNGFDPATSVHFQTVSDQQVRSRWKTAPVGQSAAFCDPAILVHPQEEDGPGALVRFRLCEQPRDHRVNHLPGLRPLSLQGLQRASEASGALPLSQEVSLFHRDRRRHSLRHVSGHGSVLPLRQGLRGGGRLGL